MFTEEADFLGDKIGLMSGGRMRAMGTSLFLKNHFGSGYQIHILGDPARTQQLEGVIQTAWFGSCFMFVLIVIVSRL